MRILFYTLFFSVILFARANPFEATDTFEIQRQQVLQERLDEKAKQKQLKQEVLEQKQAQEEYLKLKQAQEERLKQEQAKQEILRQQLAEQKRQNLVKKERLEKISKSKCKTDFTLNILPFVTINSDSNNFQLKIKKPYKLINQDINRKKRKFIFDFAGHASFYTKRKTMCHPYFESLTIGTHLKKNFFRVVIVVRENILNYKETIDANNGTISIEKIK